MTEKGDRVGFVLFKDLIQTKKNGEKESEKKDIKGMKLALATLMLCLSLMKTPNQNRSVLNGCTSVLGFFWVKFQSVFGLGLVLRNFCIKETLGF